MNNSIENPSSTELASQKFEIAPCEGEKKWAKNIVVIPENTTTNYLEVVRVARENDACEDNSNEEAGDNVYAVQFPGNDKPEFVNQDQLQSKLRELGITE